MNLSTLGQFIASAARVGGLASEPKPALVQAVAENINLGIDPSHIQTSKVTLASLLVDDSGSMEWASESVVSAIQGAIQQIRGVSSRHDILLGVLGICRGWLLPYTRIDSVKFDGSRYVADGKDTPLYVRTNELLISLLAKQGQLAEFGIETRSVSLILTDGINNCKGYYPVTVFDLQTQFRLLLSKRNNSVFGFGFGDRASFALQQMGIPQSQVTNGASLPELHRAFEQFSRATSAVAAQGTAKNAANITVR